MSHLMIHLTDGLELSFVQAAELARLIEATPGHKHWHLNDCGCCVTLHGPDHAYVINRDGDALLYPGRGCQCDHE